MAVVVPIAADYDNSGVKSAQQAFAQFGSALSKTLQQASRDARRAFGDLEDGAKDSSTAAQRLAQAITGAADKLDTELTKSRTAAEALAKALGPELVARSGGINKVVRDLQKAGLTLDDIANEADTLAAALKKVDDVQLKNVTAQADKLDTTIRSTEASTERARGVFGGFVGGATSELPGLTSAFGPLSQGIDQAVSGLVEGNLQFAELAKFAGPIAAITGAIALISGAFKASSERARILKEDVDTVRTAILEQRDAVDALAESNRNSGKAEAFDKGKGLFGGVEDVLPKLVDLKITQEDINTVLRGGKEAVDQFASGLRAKAQAEVDAKKATDKAKYSLDQQRLDLKKYDDVISFVKQNLKALEKGELSAEQVTAFFGGTIRQFNSTLDATAIAAGAAQIAVDRKAASDEAARLKTEAAKRAEDQYARSIDGVREAFYKRNNASYAAEDAELNARDAIDAANKAQEKANRTRKPKDIADAAQATRDAQRAINDAAAATDAYTAATSSSTDATTVARDRTAAVVRQLKELELTIKAGSPLWDSIQAYKFLLETIPTEVTTKFGISFGNVRTPAPGRLELPQLSSGAITGNAGGVTNNITINGAIDRVGTATELNRITTQQNQRYGTGN